MAAVSITLARKTLFVGAYTRVKLTLDPTSGLTLDDIELQVPSGLAGGLVSMARGRDFDKEKNPTPLLLAGYEPGTHVLQVVETSSGSVLDEVKYRVNTSWRSKKSGPPLWFSGSQQSQLAGSAWGGGPTGPQNVGTAPATGTRRIAVLLVDTSTERFTDDEPTLQGHRDRWMDELINGVTVSGQQRSARAFYQEVSYGVFDISAAVFGPVSLPGTFDSYFKDDGAPKGTFYQAAITAGDSLIDYNQFDTVLCVSQGVPADGATPARSAWPYASIGHWGPYTTSEGNKNLGVISMPNDWGLTDDREIHETFSHELGHNLGLGDQYAPDVPGRNPGGWEMMHADDPFPHFSVAHRMNLGWVQPGWLRTFNFASSGAPVDQTVVLHAIEKGAPPAGRSTAAEIRIGDGLNYYFEYRNGESPQIGDRDLPNDNRVLGTDVASPPFDPPFSRPAIILLPADGDDSGNVLANGDFYREIDASPFPVEFRADVSAINGTRANLRIRYGTNGRPDPSIRPWPASSDRQWQSPDIEVRNAKSLADPQWTNVPWVGNPNTIVARVKNGGTVMAPQVRVNFSVRNFNIGGAPEVSLGSDVRDIAPGDTEEFTYSGWVPPTDGHFCVVVRIPLYIVATAPTVVEMTELNNLAQSNYDRFVTATGSPSTREETSVLVGNPYDQPTRVWIVGEQTNPLYRSYIETTWLWLEPGETRKVRVMVEYALDPKSEKLPDDVGRLKLRNIEKLTRVPNNLGLHAYAENPADNPRHSLELLGGAGIQVSTGRGTEFESFGNDGDVAFGRIVTSDDHQPVADGQAVITATQDPRDVNGYRSLIAQVEEGTFSLKLRTKSWKVIRAEYLPTSGLAPCSVDWTERH